MDRLFVLPAFADNLVYLYRVAEGRVIVIDPGDPEVVLRALQEHHLELTAALVTHHHSDHTGGIPGLKQATGCQVIGSDMRIRGIDRVVQGGDHLQFGDTAIAVLASPGHTRTSVCYYKSPDPADDTGMVWTGDTLFVGGCGRLFECDAAVLWKTLTQLALLPGATQVLGGHNYAVENYRFALTIEPHNQAIHEALDRAIQAGESMQAVTSTMDQERLTNVLLRADHPDVKASLDMEQADPKAVFAELRRRKDIF